MSFQELTEQEREIDAVCRNMHKSLMNSYHRGMDMNGEAFSDLVAGLRSNAQRLPQARQAY